MRKFIVSILRPLDYVFTSPDSNFLENVGPKTKLVQKLTLRDYTITKVFAGRG